MRSVINYDYRMCETDTINPECQSSSETEISIDKCSYVRSEGLFLCQTEPAFNS